MGFTSLAALSSGVCFVLTSGVGSFTTHHCHFHITASSLEHLLLWVLCHPGEIFSLFDWCDYDMGSWLILSIIGHHLMHLKSLLSVKHILIPCIGTAISLVSATIISFLDFFFFWLFLQHMEVPRPEDELKLQVPAYATAKGTQFLSHICNLCCSL